VAAHSANYSSRNHVKRDLEPYNCYLNSCQDPIKTFRTFRKWFEHAKEVHTAREWMCNATMHGPLKFEDEGSFRDHMVAKHRDTFTDSQLNILAKINSKPLSRPFDICPFCNGRPDDCPSLEEQERTGKPDHLPRHVCIISQFPSSLPGGIMRYSGSVKTKSKIFHR